MKSFLYIATLLGSLAITTVVQAQTKTYRLSITVANIVDRKGSIRIGLVTKAENFMGKSEIDTAVVVPADGPVKITLNLPAGTYAVRLYQDMNDNKQLDRENGLPTEPFGFSKIAMLMGPPSFEEAAFSLTEDTELKIGLISL